MGTWWRLTEASVRGECREDGWFPSISKMPFSWWFSDGVVSASAISVELISLDWVESTVGQAIATVSSSETSCIFLSYRIRYLSSGVLSNLVGKF